MPSTHSDAATILQQLVDRAYPRYEKLLRACFSSVRPDKRAAGLAANELDIPTLLQLFELSEIQEERVHILYECSISPKETLRAAVKGYVARKLVERHARGKEGTNA